MKEFMELLKEKGYKAYDGSTEHFNESHVIKPKTKVMVLDTRNGTFAIDILKEFKIKEDAISFIKTTKEI